MHGLDFEQHLGGGVGDRLAVEACHGRILGFLKGRLGPVLIGDQAAAGNGAWRSGNVRSREISTEFDARVAGDFTRLTRRGRSRSGCSLLKLSCESRSCRAIDAYGFACPRAVSVENGAARQFYGAVYTIYPRK